MRKKDKTYSVIIISDSTSANKEFTISSKLIKKVLTLTFVLIFTLVFIIFDYLTISFDKVKMKELEHKIMTLQNERKKADLSAEKNLNNKLKILDKIQKSINSMDLDISKKKDLIKELIQIDNKLKSKKKKLNEIKPTLQKSKEEYSEYVKIFSDHYKKVYDEIYKKRIWKECIIYAVIGLFIGIISSIIGGYIRSVFKKK
jgi:septal ring factor EnvC (AmiA/AmiB activator)